MNDVLEHLTDDELAVRICMLDLLEEIVKISDGTADEMEDRLGMFPAAVRVYELSDEQLKLKVDEALLKRVETLRAELGDEPDKRATMLELIEEAPADTLDLAAYLMELAGGQKRPAIHRELLTNEQLRQMVDECLRIRVGTLRRSLEYLMELVAGKVSRTIN